MSSGGPGLAVMGGTFDPIHYGHLRSASGLFEHLNITGVRLIPSHQPPHRATPGATSQQRLAMLKLAVEEFSAIQVDDRELRRTGPSYTVDTLQQLRAECADVPLYFVLGQDAFDKLYEWYRWEELTDFAHLVVLTRPGFATEVPAPMNAWAATRMVDQVACMDRQPAGLVGFLGVVHEDVSATGIRQLFGSPMGAAERDKALQGKLPRRVVEYIDSHGLYGAGG